jgi:hypothetical protein
MVFYRKKEIALKSKSGRNLLMIAYKFPPMHNTSCVRTWGFHQSIKPYFDTVTVISTSNRHLLRQEVVDMCDAEVYDAKTLDYRTVLQRKENEQSVLTDNSKESPIGKFAQKLNASYASLYIFGEGGIKYIRAAFKIGKKLLEEKSITHIFSTFSPYADHIIAHRLKAKDTSLFWIADFRDLHIDPTQSNMMFRNQQRKWNSKILKTADIITTVSKGLALHLKEFNSNVYVLRNGIEELSAGTVPLKSEKFIISYTGSMYGDRRNPDMMLRAVADLIKTNSVDSTKFLLLYAGKDSGVWRGKTNEFGLGDIFEDRGLVSRKEALSIQRDSNINLLLTYSSSELTGNITGKIFEYFNARRPVLVLINGPRDEEIENLVAADLGQVAYDKDYDRVRDFIFRNYNKWVKGDYYKDIEYNELLKSFSWKNMITDFADHIGLA